MVITPVRVNHSLHVWKGMLISQFFFFEIIVKHPVQTLFNNSFSVTDL